MQKINYDVLNPHLTMLDEVIEGLNQPQKTLPSKYFYDEYGSELFDQITELDEYYPTRTEHEILIQNVEEIGKTLGEEVILIEPGSGSSEKTEILLERLENICCYIPMDISGDYLFKVAERLQLKYQHIQISPLSADYTRPFTLPETNPKARKVVFFPGSTIGNFKIERVRHFFKIIHDLVGRDGALLIGADLKKDIKVLLAAYNDSKGVTAQFNKNVLTHINRELGSNFDLDLFEHQSIWNEEKGRIEMHLIALEDHKVKIGENEIEIGEGESIHTENSHKYSLKEFEEMVSEWFNVEKVWTDEKKYFSVQYLVPK